MSELLLDRAGRRRSPATLPGFHAGHAPGNKGLRYPADPPKVEEIIAVMRTAGDGAHGRRLRGLIVIMWRAGLRIQEALALTEGDLDQRRGSLLVRRGKGGRRREVGMDAWGWEQLQPWLELRRELPVGPLLCVINGTTRGRHWSPRRGTRRAAAHRRRGRSAAPLRATPAPPRPRRRDGSRRRPADRHPAPTRPQQPRHHLRLPARHRQRRDHRDRPRPTRADDPRQRLAAALIDCERERCSSRNAALGEEMRGVSLTGDRSSTLVGQQTTSAVSPGLESSSKQAPTGIARGSSQRPAPSIRTSRRIGRVPAMQLSSLRWREWRQASVVRTRSCTSAAARRPGLEARVENQTSFRPRPGPRCRNRAQRRWRPLASSTR